MVNEETLSTVLSEFARTVITDFPIQAILDHLVERIVEVLPISAAGVTLISAALEPHYIAASSPSALRFERLQTEIGQGPCVLAYETGQAVAVHDLVTDERFPLFAPAAIEAGLAAVFTFPLRHGDERLGALDLYSDTIGRFDLHDMGVAQTLADVAAAYLLNVQARETAHETSERFHFSALHDPLTGLANRLLLEERLEHAAQRAKRSHSNAAIVFADIDRFKQVNDVHGHLVGDELLQAVAGRLSSLVRSCDTLARFAGDEFVVLCEEMATLADVQSLARRIDAAFVRPFALAGMELAVTASVGIAFAGPGEAISNDLVVSADLAMYKVKQAGGGGHQIIDVREAVLNRGSEHLEHDLRDALANGTLDVIYEPIVRSGDGQFIAVEAQLSPPAMDQGLDLAESLLGLDQQSGLMSEIGAWVLLHSCRDREQWARTNRGAELDLIVGVSAHELGRPGFCTNVQRVLNLTAMNPHALILEVTESVLVEDGDRARVVMADLNRLGVRLALDDFGAGYCSLSDLRELPIQIVKIGRRFVADVDEPRRGRPIVAAVTNLAHTLGFSVFAEGVETQLQSDELQSMGCDFAEGKLFGLPMSAIEIGARLKARPATPPPRPEREIELAG